MNSSQAADGGQNGGGAEGTLGTGAHGSQLFVVDIFLFVIVIKIQPSR